MGGHTPRLEKKKHNKKNKKKKAQQKKKKQGEMPLPIPSPSPKFYNCQQKILYSGHKSMLYPCESMLYRWFHSIFSLWQPEGITSPCCLHRMIMISMPSSFYGKGYMESIYTQLFLCCTSDTCSAFYCDAISCIAVFQIC